MAGIDFKVKSVPVDKITIDVHVKITRQFRLRMWLGFMAIRFLAFVWDCDVIIVGADMEVG